MVGGLVPVLVPDYVSVAMALEDFVRLELVHHFRPFDLLIAFERHELERELEPRLMTRP